MITLKIFQSVNGRLIMLFVSCLFFLTACNESDTANPSGFPVTGNTVGIFKDSPVSGLYYSAKPSSLEGITNNGIFHCDTGDDISFYIGKILLGTTTCQQVITLIDIVPDATDEKNDVVTNIARFLQTIDSDKDPYNGINIDERTAKIIGESNNIINITLDFDTNENLKNLFTELNITDIKTAEDAQKHFHQTLAIEQLPKPPSEFTGTYDLATDERSKYLHLSKDGAFMLEATQWPRECLNVSDFCESPDILRSYGIYIVENDNLTFYTLSAREIIMGVDNRIVDYRNLKDEDIDHCWPWSLSYESIAFSNVSYKTGEGINFSKETVLSHTPTKPESCGGENFVDMTLRKVESDPSIFMLPIEMQSTCNIRQIAGGDNRDIRTIQMGAVEGSFEFVYNTDTIPDQIILTHEGKKIFDTGCVSTSDESKSTITYSGSMSTIKVEVLPNCAGHTSGTAWDYTINCP